MPLIVALFILAPSLIFAGTNSDSLSSGIIFSSALIYFYVFLKYKNIYFNKFQIYIVIICLLSIIISPAINIEGILKQLISLFSLILITTIITSLIHFDEENFFRACLKIFPILVIILIAGISRQFDFSWYSKYGYAIPPFVEPSHFSLVYLPIACIMVASSRPIIRYFIFLFTFLTAIYIPNLTLLITSFLLLFIFIKPIYCFIISVIIAFIYTFLNYLEPLQFNYFIERLDFFNPENTNLSKLVYFKGWEQAFSTISFSNGLGIGFQRMGEEPQGEVAEILFSTYNTIVNMYDGGFLASKIITEFGLIGIIVVFFLLYLSIRSGICLRSIIINNNDKKFIYILPLSFTYSLFMELLIRGIGYFSPTFIISISIIPISLAIIHPPNTKCFNVDEI